MILAYSQSTYEVDWLRSQVLISLRKIICFFFLPRLGKAKSALLVNNFGHLKCDCSESPIIGFVP